MPASSDLYSIRPIQPIREIRTRDDVLGMTTTSCCGTTPRDITISLSDSTLAFLYCEVCESRNWFRNGTPVTLGEVKTEAAAAWNRKSKREAQLLSA